MVKDFTSLHSNFVTCHVCRERIKSIQFFIANLAMLVSVRVAYF